MECGHVLRRVELSRMELGLGGSIGDWMRCCVGREVRWDIGARWLWLQGTCGGAGHPFS